MTTSGTSMHTINPKRINVTIRQTEGQFSYLQMEMSPLSRLTVEDKMRK